MSFLVTIRLPHDACIAVSFAHGASASVRDLKLAAFQAIGPTPDGCEDSFTLDGEGRGPLSALTTDAQTFDDAGISNEATVTVTRRRECCSICVHHSARPVCVHMHRVYLRAALCAYLLGCAERHCARCQTLFTGEEHAVFRTVCCRRLLCHSCLPDPAAPHSCWYCAGQDSCHSGTAAEAVSTGNIRDEAVAKHLMRQRCGSSTTRYTWELEH